MNIGIIGAGAWGTALGITVARGGANATLWSYDGAMATFDGVSSPHNLTVTSDMADMANMDAWLIVTPAAYFRETVIRAREFYRGAPIIICTKGADPKTGELPAEILNTELPECTEYGALSGPQFAGEVAHGIKTGSTLAGTPATRAIGKSALCKLELDDSDDIIGAQICGVGKNVVALICGYNSVCCHGENERALIFTRAWGDVVRIGHAMGAQTATFLQLCGIGDLFLTATSETSRNFAAGIAIAHGQPPAGTVEGICALHGLIKRATTLGVETPTLCAMRDKLGI